MRFHPAYDIINVGSRLRLCNACCDWLLEYGSQSCHGYSSFLLYRTNQRTANLVFSCYNIMFSTHVNILVQVNRKLKKS